MAEHMSKRVGGQVLQSAQGVGIVAVVAALRFLPV